MKLPPLVEKELAPLKGRWTIELGGRHYKIKVDGHLAGILPYGRSTERNKRSELNLRSNIRRLIAERA